MQTLAEDINVRSLGIDSLPTLDILRLINDEDAQVAAAVARQLAQIAVVVEGAVAALSSGGRLIYVGAGTSGRLGVLDAAECIPTFGIEHGRVLAVLAGGPAAMTASIESAEDDAEAGGRAMQDNEVGPSDLVLGIASSGRTPFVVGALRQARIVGAATAALVGSPDGPVAAGRRDRGCRKHWSGGHRWVYPPKGGHGSEDGAEYDLYRRYGALGANVWQSDGRSSTYQ